LANKKYLYNSRPCDIHEDEGGVFPHEHQKQTRAKDEPTEESQLGAQAEEAAAATRARASRNADV
jgi:hypothetical protein